MIIKNQKWKRISIIYGIALSLVLILKVIPRFNVFITNLYTLVYESYADKTQEENKIFEKKILFENKKLKKEFATLISNSNQPSNLSTIIELIDNLANECNVRIESIHPGKIVNENNIITQVIDITIISKYENYYNFIRFLEKSSKILLLKKFVMQPEKESNTILQIKTNFEAYLNL